MGTTNTTAAAKKTMAQRIHNVNLELCEAEDWAKDGKPGAKAMVKALWKTLGELNATYEGMVTK